MRAPLTHLERLEAEAIHILREVAAECARPVMLYSMGKDSAAMLHLARKAFHPAPPPFPLLHVDTGWKFQEMYAARDRLAAEAGIDLIVHRNPDAEARGINPFDHGALHTDTWKTQGLRQAIDRHGFDAAFGGARRDEERSRAKERVFSFRDANHGWDPRRQRPELWHLYNARTGPGETIRVFPLSNWTELDVWRYIAANDVAVASLYLAAMRPTYRRDGRLFMADDPDRLERVLGHRLEIVPRRIRFRTLGCAPLTAAIESEAATLAQVIDETARATVSERGGRVIDAGGDMERKKREGYF